jgi:ATP-dependent DNA helicase RecQ
MFWLIDSLQNLRENFPRLLIYCTSINDASKVYNYVVEETPSCGQFIELYHSQTEDSKKEYIVNELQNYESSLRLLVSTSALGMGIDTKGFHSVVVFGAQKNCSELVQEIGRVGRDHQPSVALVLYNSYHQRSLDQEVKKFVGTNGCRRLSLLENFLEEKDLKNTVTGHHYCCDNCEENCKCNNCELLPIEKILRSISDAQEDTDTDSDNTEVYEILENGSDSDL